MSAFEISEREERLANWLATPRKDRRPGSLQELADELEVHVSQLYRWKRRANLQQRVREIVDDAVGGPERIRAVVERLFEDAMVPGAVNSQKLVLQYAGFLQDRRERTTPDKDDISEMDDEALAEARAQLKSEQRENLKKS